MISDRTLAEWWWTATLVEEEGRSVLNVQRLKITHSRNANNPAPTISKMNPETWGERERERKRSGRSCAIREETRRRWTEKKHGVEAKEKQRKRQKGTRSSPTIFQWAARTIRLNADHAGDLAAQGKLSIAVIHLALAFEKKELS